MAAATPPSTATACAWGQAKSIRRSRRCPKCWIPWWSISNISAAKATCRCSWCCARASRLTARWKPRSTRRSRRDCPAALCRTRSLLYPRSRARSPARSRSCRSSGCCSVTPSKTSSTRTRWPIRRAWSGIWNSRGIMRSEVRARPELVLRGASCEAGLAAQACPDAAEDQKAADEMDRRRWLAEDEEGQQRTRDRADIEHERGAHRAELAAEPGKARIGEQARYEPRKEIGLQRLDAERLRRRGPHLPRCRRQRAERAGRGKQADAREQRGARRDARLHQRVAGPAEHREHHQQIAPCRARLRECFGMTARDDQERAGKRQHRAEPLQWADMLHAAGGRDQQHHDRRQRHDQRDVDRGGRDAGDIDRTAAEEHAHEASGQDRPRVPDERNLAVSDLQI